MKNEYSTNVVPAFESIPRPAGPHEVISGFGGASGNGGRKIGAILIDEGKLTPDEAERALLFQRQNGLRFGEALVQLGIVTEADVSYALSRQFDYPYLLGGESDISPEVIAAYSPFDSRVEAFRALRTQLTLRWLEAENSSRAFAIVSAARGDGRSYIAANMAVAFAQLGEHTLLIDADMRNPRQHMLFGLDNRSGLSDILSGRGSQQSIQHVPTFRELSVIPSGALPPNPQELLARPYFGRLIDGLAADFSVILVDTPAGGSVADAQFVSKATRAALMVVRRDATHVKAASRLMEDLSAAKVSVVGSAFNDF
jgi:receptor protein-tyrosine kinase